MHELSIMNEVLAAALRVAEKNGGRRVVKITLEIGVMSGVMPQFVQSFFELISKDTIAKDAAIEIETDPAVFKCLDCGEAVSYDKISPEYVCAACGSKALRLVSGYGFKILSVAIV